MFGFKKKTEKNIGSVDSLKDRAQDTLEELLEAGTALIEKNPERISEVLRDFPDKFATFASKLPWAEKLGAVYYALRDPRTPRATKATLAAALAYFVLPTDFIPDFVPGLGFSDDFGVLMLVLNRVSSAILPEHYESARRRLKGEQESAE